MGEHFREQLYDVIEVDDDGNKWSKLYDYFMIVAISVSLIPLMVKEPDMKIITIDKVCAGIFVVDYILHMITSDYKYKGKPLAPLRYSFSFLGIVDLLSIVPSLVVPSILPFVEGMQYLKVLKVLKLARFMKVIRIMKFFRYSKSLNRVDRVIKYSKDSLLAVCSLTVMYIFISALIVFNVEPQTFKSFFEALYWATVSLATIGYGDITPVSAIGRLMTMISSIFGIAIVALPAGVITAGYMHELDREAEDREV